MVKNKSVIDKVDLRKQLTAKYWRGFGSPLPPAGIERGDYMSKKKKNRIDGNYSYIEHNIINSEAWKGLKAHTKWLYFEFKLRWYGDNTRSIILRYNEAKNIMAIDTFIGDRKQLIERGFIDIMRRGGLEKQSMIYGLSDRWKKYGTKDFIKIDIKDILPEVYTIKFKKGHKFMGNRFKKK